MTDYKALYLKYKKKYLQNKNQYGGVKHTTAAVKRHIERAMGGLKKSITKQEANTKRNQKIRTTMLLLTAAAMYLPQTDLPGKAIEIEQLRGEGVDDVREFLDPMPEWENKTAKRIIKTAADSVRKNSKISKISKNKPLRSQKKISKTPQKARRYSTRRSQKK